MVIFSMTLTDP